MYPPDVEGCDVTIQSWVQASHVDLDAQLADALVDWIAAESPWKRLDRCGR